ncbi:MAG: endolytic transglycosylase MltG [Candidatus Pacebacteria bacterium]|nr:endolytic transglycosylase MltG [Candidatus Paceibacterota bacterium]
MTNIKKGNFDYKKYEEKIRLFLFKERRFVLFHPKEENDENEKEELKDSRKNIKRSVLVFLLTFFVTSTLFVLYLVKAPQEFPVGRIINIEQGANLTEISQTLTEKSVINSPLFLKLSVRYIEKDSMAIAGDYFFDKPLSVFDVAKKITLGEYGLTPIKVTILEGTTISEMAEIFEGKFPEFNSEHFVELAEGSEGYLFPDTYSFLLNTKEDQIFKEMRDNFDKKIASIQEEIDASGRPLEEIIIMASIIEKEAWKEEDRRLISGVLWNRIEIGMPLQVDAAFLYINGKSTYHLTYDDLDIDSPYNTYKYKGLPVGPICNPSLSSLKAAVLPEESEYLFYLADRNGNTYYAFNFEGHKKNKWLYMN